MVIVNVKYLLYPCVLAGNENKLGQHLRSICIIINIITTIIIVIAIIIIIIIITIAFIFTISILISMAMYNFHPGHNLTARCQWHYPPYYFHQ